MVKKNKSPKNHKLLVFLKNNNNNNLTKWLRKFPLCKRLGKVPTFKRKQAMMGLQMAT